MSWWEAQINNGWKGPVGQPRGSTLAPFPLKTGVRYRVSLDGGKKPHLLRPGRDYAYCGITLAPEDGWLIDSGYDAFYWIVAEHDYSRPTCRDCTHWKDKSGREALPLPTDSPIEPSEWAATVGEETRQRALKLDRMADTVAAWFGAGAERVKQ